MNFLVKAAVIAAALGASAVASADTFDFTYTFADGLPAGQDQEITGSFTGTAGTDGSGLLTASNISNIAIQFNGVTFTGGSSPSLILNAWDTATEAFDAPSSTVTIYANSAENNFGISDVDQSVSAAVNGGPNYFFNVTNDANPKTGNAVTAFNLYGTDAFSAGGPQFDSDDELGQWTLTDVAPVPVPGALPLLMSGLGLLGAAIRRRVA